MTKSNQTLNPNFLFFVFFLPLLQAYTSKKCSSSDLICGLDYFNRILIRFPFCGHPQFNLTCIARNTTILQLPMSGPFLVTRISYYDQEIRINDPDKCLVKHLLTFNTSGSPFTARYLVDYTFLICPKKVVKSWYRPIACLSNLTHSFLATSDFSLVTPLLPSCEIVKTVSVPVSWMGYIGGGFLSSVNELDLLLKWGSPNCGVCERQYKRCGFKNKASLQVKCFDYEKPGLNKGLLILIITILVLGGITIAACIAFRIYKSNRLVSRRTLNTELAAATVTQRPDEIIVATRGLDDFIIDSLTKIELGDSIRLPGSTNSLICPICLSEYESKDIVRCLPDCDHCFHLQCIDPWLKIHGSCPICRNSKTFN